MEKYKARFVAKGYSEVEEIANEETFSLVARYLSIRSIFALDAQIGLKTHHMDVKKTFFNGFIEEEVYIEHPKGFDTFDQEFHVCRLK